MNLPAIRPQGASPPPRRPVASQPLDRLELRLSPPTLADRAADLVAAMATSSTLREAALDLDKQVFHGSAIRFERVEPRLNTRIGDNDKVVWQGTAIFTAPDPRVALFYTASRGGPCQAGIDMITPLSPSQKPVYFLEGGASKEEALDRVYGRAEDGESGWLYVLDKRRTVHEPGLGANERITRDSDANLGRLGFNRRLAVERLEAEGLIEVRWRPRS